ncbi:sensor histidine kinase [Streptomyces sp. NPDC002536]
MTDTYETGLHSEELRVARTFLHRLREDLVTDAFAFRPLPPLAADHRLVRALPRRAARYTRWLPHTVVVGFALMIMLATVEHAGFLPALFVGVPIMTTLVRPVGAWWLSFGVMFLTGMVSPFGYSISPWSPGGFLPHVAVMVLVALRTRPRVAAGMWLLTGALAVFLGVFRSYGGALDGGLFQMVVFTGFVLFAVVAVRGLREGKQQVEAQAAVTQVERSRRTLLEERTTIARELHDVVAHHMSVVAIQAEAAPYRVQDTPPELAAAFQTIRENAVAALTELRRVLGVVRSEEDAAPEAPQPTLADLGLLLGNVRSAGLEVEHVTTGAVRPLPQGVELSAYRIVQEALSNVLRHAPGATARVEVSYVLGGLGLRIVNGPADRLAKPSPGAGHGVLGMRERVGMLGGGMTAEATEDGGYEVAAFIPVAMPGEAAA